MEKTQKKLIVSKNHSTAYENLVEHYYDRCVDSPYRSTEEYGSDWDAYRQVVRDELQKFNAVLCPDISSQVTDALFSSEEDYVHFCLAWS